MTIEGLRRRAAGLYRSSGIFPGRLSYSQFGEDVIVASIFWYLHIPKPTYLDIGAFAPAQLSNTFFFYKRGSQGVCVEANPKRTAAFRRIRRRDTCLNVGIGPEDKPGVPFYVLNPDALSTFDEASAQEHEKNGHARIQSMVSVPIYSINTLLEKHFSRCPDFLSLDIEGLDVAVLQSLDFERYRPAVICVETIDYYTQGKNLAAAEFLESQGYRVQADTVINTIFVDEKTWVARR